MVLTPITHDNSDLPTGTKLPEIAHIVIRQTRDAYDIGGFQSPWIGYLGMEGQDCVGTCAFKGKPMGGDIAIAYFTFPGHEGRGIASGMAKELVKIAKEHSPELRIIAQTLPNESASTSVLKKSGFTLEQELEHIEDGRVWQWQWQGC
ncbi:MAG: GNAT family N-acetyltransferase [Limisphaerales bacterium]